MESGNEDEKPLIQARLPSYLSDAFGELYQEDGLVVLGQGLGILPLLASFVRFYADTAHGHLSICNEVDEEYAEGERSANPNTKTPYQQRPPLVFVLGLKEAERSTIVSLLQSWGTPPALLPTLVTNESGQAKEREVMYRRGGIFIITSRILIVDLLTNTARPAHIEGMLVAHAEHVTEQSTEAFILRIYRTQRAWLDHSKADGAHDCRSNSNTSTAPESITVESPTPTVTKAAGFVKAFTDDPASLMSGFAKVDKILKSLRVRKIYLYPRFHSNVADELENNSPQVIELHQKLTPHMKEVQAAIVAAMQTCIQQLKRDSPLIQLSDPDISIKNCMSKNFDLALSRQLDQDWHRLKPSTKNLVSDLRTLRSLLQYLIQYDCVKFWKLIQSIKAMSAASRYPSMWLLEPTGEMLFQKAKERLYKIVAASGKSKMKRPLSTTDEPQMEPSVLHPFLEENPKWGLLRKVLTEIQDEFNKNHNFSTKAARILVMVKDERTIHTLQSCLTQGSERTMNLQWLRYLESANALSRAILKGEKGIAGLSEEARLLLEEEGRARNFLFGAQKNLNVSVCVSNKMNATTEASPTSVPSSKKRRRISEEISRGQMMNQSERQQRLILDEAILESEHISTVDDFLCTEFDAEGELLSGSGLDVESSLPSVSKIEQLQIVFRSYSNMDEGQSYLLLNDIRPCAIVLYDADPSFIRSIEIYSSMISEDTANDASGQISSGRLKVYFMLMESSFEEQMFLKTLEREQSAFERLIQHVKSMPLPVNTLDSLTQELETSKGIAGTYSGQTLPLSIDTRTGVGKQSKEKERRDVVLDVREFRSILPSMLHQGGMRLAPVTLTVGDYVLTSVHCIERKSISDLFGSFNSGRLHTQAEQMIKYYKCPCLLIEFDPNKSFCLQNKADIGGDIRTDSISSKLCLLVMHFPQLRLLWSREPHETLKLFKVLKQNHEEVNVSKAVECGRSESLDEALGIAPASEVTTIQNDLNEAARDMLLRIPGININNARKVMSVCDSMAEFVDMSREDLKQLLGPITGQKVFTFFRKQLASL